MKHERGPMTAVAWAPNPFGTYDGNVFRAIRPAGMTIAEILATIPNLPANFAEAGTVCLNGEPIERRYWARVKPRQDGPLPVSVTLHMPLRGGGQGVKSAIAIVAAIAVIAAASFISGGALAIPAFQAFGAGVGSLFLAGNIGAIAASAAVTLAGSLLVQALTPPPVIPASPGAGGDSSKGSASAEGNVVSPGGTFPRVCGTMKVFPSLAMEPLIEIVGDDEVVSALYALGGPHEIDDVRVAGATVSQTLVTVQVTHDPSGWHGSTAGALTEIVDTADISVETRQGLVDDDPLTLITRQNRSSSSNVSLPNFSLVPTRPTRRAPASGY
jgi:hypothetical protein